MKKNRLLCAGLCFAMTCLSVSAVTIQTFAAGIEEDAEYTDQDLKYKVEDGHAVITACAENAETLELHGGPPTVCMISGFCALHDYRFLRLLLTIISYCDTIKTGL